MDVSIYATIFERLAWVVGLLCTIVVCGGLFFIIGCGLATVPKIVWLVCAAFGTATCILLKVYISEWYPLLDTAFWICFAVAAAGWLGAIPLLVTFISNLRNTSEDWSDGSYARAYQSKNYQEKNEESASYRAIQKVLSLEKFRIAKGYKPGWLYHRCREDPSLLIALSELITRGYVESSGSRESHEYADRVETRKKAFNPYEVLGTKPNATPDEVRAAYLARMKEYHPDRVSHLGADLRALAEERTKTIQQAYEMLRTGT